MSETIFVGDLSFSCREEDLVSLISPHGQANSVIIRRGKQGESLQYGFIQMESIAARDFVASWNNVKFLGRKLRLNIAEGPLDRSVPPDRSGFAKVLVSFMSQQVDSLINEETLDRIFSHFGEVEDISMKNYFVNMEQAKQTGFAFVYFTALDVAIAAIHGVNDIWHGRVQDFVLDCHLSHDSARRWGIDATAVVAVASRSSDDSQALSLPVALPLSSDSGRVSDENIVRTSTQLSSLSEDGSHSQHHPDPTVGLAPPALTHPTFLHRVDSASVDTTPMQPSSAAQMSASAPFHSVYSSGIMYEQHSAPACIPGLHVNQISAHSSNTPRPLMFHPPIPPLYLHPNGIPPGYSAVPSPMSVLTSSSSTTSTPTAAADYSHAIHNGYYTPRQMPVTPVATLRSQQMLSVPSYAHVPQGAPTAPPVPDLAAQYCPAYPSPPPVHHMNQTSSMFMTNGLYPGWQPNVSPCSPRNLQYAFQPALLPQSPRFLAPATNGSAASLMSPQFRPQYYQQPVHQAYPTRAEQQPVTSAYVMYCSPSIPQVSPVQWSAGSSGSGLPVATPMTMCHQPPPSL